jgi:hypothetical protein
MATSQALPTKKDSVYRKYIFIGVGILRYKAANVRQGFPLAPFS